MMFKEKFTHDETLKFTTSKYEEMQSVTMFMMGNYFVNVHNTLLHKPVSLNEAHIFLNIY